MNRTTTFCISGLVLLAGASAQAGEVCRLETRGRGFSASCRFEVTHRTELKASLLVPGCEGRQCKDETAFEAWILDSRTRQEIWSVEPSKRRGRDEAVEKVTAEIEVPPGIYEAFFAVAPSRRWEAEAGEWWQRFGQALLEALGGESDSDEEQHYRFLLEGEARPLVAGDDRGREAFLDRAVVRLRADDTEAELEQGFEVRRPVRVTVYCLGEVLSGTPFDYGWLRSLESGEIVWTFEPRQTQWAGGARKNRLVRQDVQLAPGRYVAAYVSEDSHSPGDWNDLPPRDPDFWGLTLLVAPEDRDAIRLFDYEEIERDRVFLELTRVGDSAVLERGFELLEKTTIRVQALGEGTERYGMVDYGWITEFPTGRRVWEMRWSETSPAGGATKNRRSDLQLELSAGHYLATYVTDGSHSFGAWNSSPPRDRDRWGMTLSLLEDDAAIVRAWDPEGGDAIARIGPVRDDQHLAETFRLAEDTLVVIEAVGEGSGGEMYDYGWIEGRGGRRVWEMRYERTHAAGGASKNRRIRETVELPAGSYTLHYESDGSHSFGDWNASPPAEPHKWGITVREVPRGAS